MSLGATYYRDQLSAVNAAIAKIEANAQEVGHDSKSVKFAELADLYRERRRLEPLALREEQQSSVGGVSTVRFTTSKVV